MGVDKVAGACQVVRKAASGSREVCEVGRYDRRRNAYYPDFAYRVDGRKKCLQVLSVVGPSKFVQGAEVEAASCFNRLRAEGDAMCIEEYGKRLGYVYSNVPSSTIFFTAIFECIFGGGGVKWVNPLPFDAGAEDLVMSLARDARDWIDFFQGNISKLKDSAKHTTLSLVLQLDVINCEAWTARAKMPLGVRFAFDGSGPESQGAPKKQKGVRFRSDRCKWVAEFNPPGKKNNKISLGEYDTLAEAARAADAGMFCYGSKTSGYNFADSPSFLQQTPQPVSALDKEAVRKWARDFAKLTAPPSSLPRIGSGKSTGCLPQRVKNSAPPSPHAPFETLEAAVAISLPPSAFAPSMSDLPPCVSNSGASMDPCNVPRYDSDCTSASTLHVEDVTEYFTRRDLDLDISAAMQINGSLPQEEIICYPDEALFRPNDVDFWNAGSPMCASEGVRTVSDVGMVTDDLFQCIMSCNPSCNAEVERCNIRLIR